MLDRAKSQIKLLYFGAAWEEEDNMFPLIPNVHILHVWEIMNNQNNVLNLVIGSLYSNKC